MSVAEAVHSSSADETLRELYERHGDRVFGFCRNRLRSRQEAEDATQTTFLYAFRALQRGAFPVSEKAWLFKIAENVCFTAHRANGRRSDRELANGGELVELAPARDDQSEALFGLEEALAAIPDRQRRAFVLRELRGLSHREIAGQIGVSVTAVEMLVFRARRSLARALDSGASLKGRVASLVDLGAILNLLKTGVGGTTAAKVVAAAAVVAVSAFPAGDSPAPRERAAVTVLAEQIGLTSQIAAEQSERGIEMPDRAVDRPTSVRDRPDPDDVGVRPSRPGPGRQDDAEPVVPVAPPGADQAAPPTNPAPLPPVLPAPPPIQGPPPVDDLIAIPESPLDVAALPSPPQLAVELPDAEDLLPPPPQLP